MTSPGGISSAAACRAAAQIQQPPGPGRRAAEAPVGRNHPYGGAPPWCYRDLPVVGDTDRHPRERRVEARELYRTTQEVVNTILRLMVRCRFCSGGGDQTSPPRREGRPRAVKKQLAKNSTLPNEDRNMLSEIRFCDEVRPQRPRSIASASDFFGISLTADCDDA